MMLKTVIVFLLAVSVAWAAPFGGIDEEPEQKKIESLKDLNEFRTDLTAAIKQGNAALALPLGMSYLEGHQFSDGNEAPDIEKAMMVFETGARGGHVESAYWLSYLLVLQKKYDKSLEVLSPLLSSAKVSKPYYQAASLYATTVLDHMAQDTLEMEKAIAFLERGESALMPATARYILANLYNINGQEERANKNLQMACTDTSAPGELRSICQRAHMVTPVVQTAKKGCSDDKENCDTCDLGKRGF